eukprot:gene13079-3681_t
MQGSKELSKEVVTSMARQYRGRKAPSIDECAVRGAWDGIMDAENLNGCAAMMGYVIAVINEMVSVAGLAENLNDCAAMMGYVIAVVNEMAENLNDCAAMMGYVIAVVNKMASGASLGEKLNGQAAMMGYVIAAVIKMASGAGLVDQQESFAGKLALHVVVFAILAIRSMSDLTKFQDLADEATFYDRQWAAT